MNAAAAREVSKAVLAKAIESLDEGTDVGDTTAVTLSITAASILSPRAVEAAGYVLRGITITEEPGHGTDTA